MTYQMPNQRPGFAVEKVKRKNDNPESQLQQACVLWFDYQYNNIKKLLYATPNGGKRDRKEAAKMKAEGVRAGVPDLTLAVPRGQWKALYIEMKILPNQPTDDQREMMELLTKQGYYCQVVYTKEQFIELVNNYMALPTNN